MNTIARRLRRLEDRFGLAEGRSRHLVVVYPAGLEEVLDGDRCIQILDDCGFLPTHGMGVVYLGNVPRGLNADQLEQHLREHGAELSQLGLQNS